MVSINSKAVKYFAKIEYDNNHELQIPLLGYLDFDNDYSYAPNDKFSLIVPSTWYHLYDYGLEDIPLWNTDTAY